MREVTTIDVFGKPHKAKAEDLKLSVHVYGVAVRGGKALIPPQFDGYDWPGGTAELGESTAETLRREFKEETGYDVEPVKLLGLYDSFFHHVKRQQDYQSLLAFYLVKIVGGEISTAGFDADEKEYAKEACWIDLDELDHMRHACSIDIADELLGFARAAAKS